MTFEPKSPKVATCSFLKHTLVSTFPNVDFSLSSHSAPFEQAGASPEQIPNEVGQRLISLFCECEFSE